MVGLVTMGMLGANVGLHKTEIKSLEFINVNRLKSITNIGKHGPCSAAIAMKRFTKSSRREKCHLAKLVNQAKCALRWWRKVLWVIVVSLKLEKYCPSFSNKGRSHPAARPAK
jgi:hypothetical protein